MKRRYTLALRAAAMALVVHGCSKEPALYLGGPPGPPAALQFSSSGVDVSAGGGATIAARVLDEVGNPVPGVTPTVSSANPAIASVTAGPGDEQWAMTADISGETMGKTTLTVTAGDLSEEVVVRVGPGSMTLVGPTSVPSGATADYSVRFWDLDGNELTLPADFPPPVLSSTNVKRISLQRTSATTWTASGAEPGNLDLQLATDMAAERIGPFVNAKATVTVVPGTFTGTISATSGEPLDTIVVRAAAGRDWDGDEYVTLGSQVGINWTGRAADAQFTGTADTLVFLVPVNLAPGDYPLTLYRQGAAQIADVVGTFTVQARSTPYTAWVNPNAVPNTDGARINGKVLPLSFPTVLVEGSDVDSYYTVRAGSAALPLRATTSWIDPTHAWDVDQLWVNGAFTAYTSVAGATSANPEVVTLTVPASTMEFFWINLYAGPAAATIAVQNTIITP